MVLLADGEMPGVAAAGAESAPGPGLAQVMDELAHGVLVVTLEGRLCHANQAAQHEIGRRRVLVTQRGMIRACVPESAKVLGGALARAAEGKRSLIELAAQEGPALLLAVLPLKGDPPGAPPGAALLFARASVCESLMLCFFARSHGLTATEEHVLRILCQGFSAPDAARQLDVAVSTVRSHVRSLCAKTGSSGVRELVNRVAVLPPVAPALWHEPMH